MWDISKNLIERPLSFIGDEVIEEFKALYYQGLRAAACKINQQIAS
jgi:hypothetical protein